jgi:hypothetical protein
MEAWAICLSNMLMFILYWLIDCISEREYLDLSFVWYIGSYIHTYIHTYIHKNKYLTVVSVECDMEIRPIPFALRNTHVHICVRTRTCVYRSMYILHLHRCIHACTRIQIHRPAHGGLNFAHNMYISVCRFGHGKKTSTPSHCKKKPTALVYSSRNILRMWVTPLIHIHVRITYTYFVYMHTCFVQKEVLCTQKKVKRSVFVRKHPCFHTRVLYPSWPRFCVQVATSGTDTYTHKHIHLHALCTQVYSIPADLEFAYKSPLLANLSPEFVHYRDIMLWWKWSLCPHPRVFPTKPMTRNALSAILTWVFVYVYMCESAA